MSQLTQSRHIFKLTLFLQFTLSGSLIFSLNLKFNLINQQVEIQKIPKIKLLAFTSHFQFVTPVVYYPLTLLVLSISSPFPYIKISISDKQLMRAFLNFLCRILLPLLIFAREMLTVGICGFALRNPLETQEREMSRFRHNFNKIFCIFVEFVKGARKKENFH